MQSTTVVREYLNDMLKQLPNKTVAAKKKYLLKLIRKYNKNDYDTDQGVAVGEKRDNNYIPDYVQKYKAEWHEDMRTSDMPVFLDIAGHDQSAYELKQTAKYIASIYATPKKQNELTRMVQYYKSMYKYLLDDIRFGMDKIFTDFALAMYTIKNGYNKAKEEWPGSRTPGIKQIRDVIMYYMILSHGNNIKIENVNKKINAVILGYTREFIIMKFQKVKIPLLKDSSVEKAWVASSVPLAVKTKSSSSSGISWNSLINEIDNNPKDNKFVRRSSKIKPKSANTYKKKVRSTKKVKTL